MPPVTARPAPRHDVWRRLVLMTALGTFVPVAVLALLYVLAPTPLSAAAVQTLRTANQIAAFVVAVNLAMAVLVTVAALLRRPRRDPAAQPVRWVGRSAA